MGATASGGNSVQNFDSGLALLLRSVRVRAKTICLEPPKLFCITFKLCILA